MKYVILGGTGTLGQEITKKLVNLPDAEITIFSRGELLQKEMAKSLGNPKNVNFILGDIRDRDSVASVLLGCDVLFHVAALKHVDTLQDNPEESVKTNIIGTMNVAHAAISAAVKYVIFSSTDKAVEPVNVYGMSKGISEQIFFNMNKFQNKTRFSVFRWGNVIGSRGSAFSTFIQALKTDSSVPITDLTMTRFWITIDKAVYFMLSNYANASLFEPMIPPIKAASVQKIVHVLANLLKKPNYSLKEIGIRPGEKIHEKLTTKLSSATAPLYCDEELSELLKGIL